MKPADILYEMSLDALRKNDQKIQAFRKAMATREAAQSALYAQVAEKNTYKPTAEELKAAEKQHREEAAWANAQRFGPQHTEEEGAEEPVRRELREDSNTRSFGVLHDDDEDADSSPVVRHRAYDNDSDSDWGGSTRRFGNYSDED